MVNRHISSDLKECALRLWDAGWDREDICDALLISQASLYHWRAIFQTFGVVAKPPSPLCGCTRIITRAVLADSEAIFIHNPDTHLDELKWWLVIHHDIVISTSALSQNLHMAGLTRKLLQKIASERDYKRTAEWKEMIQQQAHCACCCLHNSSSGDRYSLVAALMKGGCIAASVVPGSFDSYQFFDFIAEEVLPLMNPFPDTRSILVIDNCHIHHNDALRDLVCAAGEQTLPTACTCKLISS
ncbi:hypothetical protein GLOTRDRAFT_31261 [Gloeophyllum trabeum ATCC 11539]|uniref:Tc1-like transposase DDE domain-containing protein n=1 Tax=Gloeophyllum trabeum (strain ATCC 11539 / FP-39264 / Madison 617) TaxID=670483 RepID=S7QNZ7_GLOTA|nr:uncharacterized protein GLOTRDRAFT_31261 [Gloeophyllum trabeum ATCC 11539]EPQ61301.1 hypothetical protein GLOTRDRAFT_31261 [Gloeophyllum trabeum ATCC 11539]